MEKIKGNGITKIKDYFKDWNIFEKTYLFGGLILSILSTIIFKGSIISTIYTITYLTNAILSSKGKVESYIFGFIGVFFYGIISYSQKYYGEILISIVLSIPIMIIGVISWFKNRDKENDVIIINTLSKTEITLAILSQVFMFFGYYYLLKYFNTSELIVSALSIVASTLAIYFGARRSEICYYFYIINDFIIITLWLIPIFQGNTPLVSVLMGPLLLFINDIYRVYNWNKLKKEQNTR